MASEFLTLRIDDVELWDDDKQEFIIEPCRDVTFRYTIKNLDKCDT